MSESSKSRSDEYDSVTDYHYLKFENRCLRASGDDFQNLFEAIMVKARPGEFERVRPYGKYGDRKCDGLIESEGIIFQVYSPDELKQAKVQKKIDEDLEGAIHDWRDILKKWVFVYNVKRGITADIKLTLQQKQQQYPGIEIACWSNDYLWEIARNQLSPQQRCELLGAPPQWNLGKPKKKNYVPSLPSRLLERSTDLGILKNLLLSSSSLSVGITEVAAKFGVHGMGGIGKSVLAGMLARDEEVQVAFPDGVFWIPLGQEPILTLRQLDLAQMLGDGSLTFQDVQQGKIHLSQLLDNRECLLILDDVWQVEHIAAFDVLDKQSKLLFTTRDSSIVKALNAIEHQVNLLSDNEALELLATCSGQAKETLPIEAYEVMKECGNLPLALSMIGAIAKARPNRWDNLLRKLQNADLDKIRHQFPDYPYADLFKAIQVSVDALDPEVRTRYLDFAVFREDVAIPEITLQTFWEAEGLDEDDTQDVIDVLVERSLARCDESRSISLHDLQYDYVRKQVADLPALHNKLLNAYATYCPQGWYSGPNDRYFFENLTFHLIEAERKEELYRLLVDSPNWMEAKFINCKGYSSYVADIILSLHHLVDPLIPKQILALVRLHAAQLVVNERVSQYIEEDLKTLVWLGRESEALSHARLTKGAVQKFLKLLAVYDTLQKKNQPNSALLDEIWQITIHIENDRSEPLKTWALRHVAVRLHASNRFEEAREVLSLAKTTASTLHPSWIYSRTASNVGGMADNSPASEPKTFTRSWVQADAFAHLAIALSKCGYQEEAGEALDQAIQIVNQIDDSQPRSGSYRTQDQCFEELTVLMSNLGYLEEAKIIARFINDSYHASEAWNALVSAFIQAQYPQAEIDAALIAAKAAAVQIDKVEVKVSKLSQLATALAKGSELHKREAEIIFEQVLQSLQRILPKPNDNWIWKKNVALSALAKAYAQLERFTDAIEISEYIESTNYRQSVLAEIAIEMIKADSPDAERVVQTIHNGNSRVEVLTKLASALAQAGETERATAFFNEYRKLAYQLSTERGQSSEVEMLYELALALIELEHFEAAEACIQAIQGEVLDISSRKANALIELGVALNRNGKLIEQPCKILKIFLKAEENIKTVEVDFERISLYRKLTSALASNGYQMEAERTAQEAVKQAPLVTITMDGDDSPSSSSEARKEHIKQLILKGCFAIAFMELAPRGLEDYICFLAKESATFEIIERGLSVKVLHNVLDVASWLNQDWKEIRHILYLADNEE